MVSYMHPRVGSNSQVVYNKYMKFDNCGTNAGYAKHYRLKEKPCNECLIAHSEYTGSWAKKNPEKMYLNTKNWRKKHPEYTQKRYSSNNYLNSKKWKENNPEKHRESCRKADRKRRSVYSEPYTELQVISLYGTVCHICNKEIDFDAPRKVGTKGWEMGLHIEHVIPLSKEGSDTLENVRPSHGICNLQKANH